MASLKSPVASPVPQLVIATTPDSLSKNVLFVDFVGLYCKSKRTRRRIGLSSSFSRFSNKKNSRLNAILSVDRQNISPPSPPPADLKPQVANLEDILSERGACGVGFIANLENKPSHAIVKDALAALGCMEHRGGCGADNDSGDGSGLMTSIPWELFDKWAESEGIGSFDKLHTGVGMVFFPKDNNLVKEAKKGNGVRWFESG